MKYPKTLTHGIRYSRPGNNSRQHKNRKFYNSYTWKKFRKGYIQHLTNKQMEEIPALSLPDQYKLHLLEHIPVCEKCYKMYTMEIQPGVKKGSPLDHIKPVNPEDALQPMDIYGEPLSYDNVQLLCERCHAEKSNEDKAFHQNIKT